MKDHGRMSRRGGGGGREGEDGVGGLTRPHLSDDGDELRASDEAEVVEVPDGGHQAARG